jgi:hypothetical protein
MRLAPIAFGQATDIAVGVPDVDGDWREAAYPPGGPPPVGGNDLWWFNWPPGLANPMEHIGTRYDDGTDVTIYDASFGQKHVGSWESYLAGTITHYCIKMDAYNWTWKSKAQVNADGNTVRWIKAINGAGHLVVVWNPVP